MSYKPTPEDIYDIVHTLEKRLDEQNVLMGEIVKSLNKETHQEVIPTFYLDEYLIKKGWRYVDSFTSCEGVQYAVVEIDRDKRR